MNIELMIYLAGIADVLRELLIVVGVIGGVILLMAACATFSEMNRLGKASMTLAMFLCFSCVLVGALIPTQKTIYTIMGYKLGKEAIKTEMAQKIYKVVDIKLDEIIEGR